MPENATAMVTPRALPKKLSELGRIRIGAREENKSGHGTHPIKLEHFRLTSANKPLLHCAAAAYGGEVVPWAGEGAPDGQFELRSTANALDVLVPTSSAISISYEQWRAGGCVRRCTGDFISQSPLDESLIGQACRCPSDDHARAAAAKTGAACARILRLNVILPDLPGLGLWRLETTGYYATAELLGSLEMLQMGQHQLVEATLRLEWRQVKRYANGKSTTLQFAVPVLWPKFTPRQLLASVDPRLLLMQTPAPLPPLPAGAQAAEDLFGEGSGEKFLTTVEQHRPNDAREVPKFPLIPSDAHNETGDTEKGFTGQSGEKNVQPISALASESLHRYRRLYQQYKDLSPAILDSIARQVWACGWGEISRSASHLEMIASDYALVCHLLRVGTQTPVAQWPQVLGEIRDTFAERYTALHAEVMTQAQLLPQGVQRDTARTLADSRWTTLRELEDFLAVLHGEPQDDDADVLQAVSAAFGTDDARAEP
jgi:hypothetical protein